MDIIDYLITCSQYAEFTETLIMLFGEQTINQAVQCSLITIIGQTTYLNIH